MAVLKCSPPEGENLPRRPGMMTLFNHMRLYLANAIFRNVFLSPSVAARPHVDHNCFVTNPSFLIHFGDAIPFHGMEWKNLTIYLPHCGIL